MLYHGTRILRSIATMSIDLNNENVGTLSEVAGKLPRLGGRKIHTSTLWRWASRGLRGVRLEHVRLGGRIITSLEAVQRFSESLSDADVPVRPPNASAKNRWPRTPAQLECDARAAEAELARRPR